MSQGLLLLSALLRNGSTTTFRLVDEDLLVGEDERNAFAYAGTHLRSYGELPSLRTVAAETGITVPVSDEAVDYYLDTVIKRKVYNQAREEFPRLRDAIGANDVDDMLESANAMRSICQPYAGQQQELMAGAALSDSVGATYDRIASIHGLSGVTTGSRYLDEQTGGYQNGDLVFWVGRPSLGKTYTLLYQMLCAWRAGHSALFVSNEMTLNQIGMRFASMLSNLDPDYVRKGRLGIFGKRLLDEGLGALASANNLNFYAGNLGKKVSQVDILMQELNPDIVYVDGVYLMQPAKTGSRSMGRYESIAFLIDELKQMTIKNDRPIICSTQFGRGSKKNGVEGSLENIGYSDAIGTHSSLVLSVKYGAPTTHDIRGEGEDGQIHVVGQKTLYHTRHMQVLKGREGEGGEWASSFRFKPTRFHDIPMSALQPEDEHGPDVSYMAGEEA